ncbi:MAG: glycosyltransferase family 4 protein [Desulfobaccales bacterium]
MRIAVLRQRLTGGGGAETTLSYLLRGLAAAGHEVVVLASEAPETGRRLVGEGAGYVAVPVWGGKAGRALSYALNARRLLRELKAQVVFSLERTLSAHVYRAGDGCHREWLARQRPQLTMAGRVWQNLRPLNRVLLWLEKKLFTAPELSRVIANSRMVREEIIRHYGLPREKLIVIHNGVDRERFRVPAPQEREKIRRTLGVGPQEKVVLFVGSGFGRKGLAYLISALAALPDTEARVWVAGRGSVRRYQNLARRLGVGDRVRFVGPVAEVAPYYQAADLLALPTLYDPLSNVVLEALACGCPVVTTTANGAAEFITPGVNGEVVAAPWEIGELARALEQTLNRGREPEVEAAAVAAVAELSWEETVRRTLAVLEEARPRS